MQKQPKQAQEIFYAKVLDMAKNSVAHHKKTATDFMDRNKSNLYLEKVKLQFQAMAFGGNEDCERRMIAFAPEDMELTEQDFPIKALHITKNKKFGQSDLNHRDYLGAILALGIDRTKVGDIVVLEEKTICYIHQDLAEYVQANLEYVSRTKVAVSISDVFAVTLPKKVWNFYTLTVASLRLDAVAGGAFHFARAKVQQQIKKEMVQVNWNTIVNPSFSVKEGDMISMRGFGRIKIFEIGSKTKKDRICVTIGRE